MPIVTCQTIARHVKTNMTKYMTLFACTLVFAACSPTPTAAPPIVSPIWTKNPIMVTVTAMPQAAIPNVTNVSAMDSSGSLWFQVLAPLDETVVNLPQVDVTGSASAGAVISVDEEILIVGLDSQFKTSVSLDEGPNLIEIIASDENGNEMSALLTVTYEP